jgi:uncharacterized protein YlaI
MSREKQIDCIYCSKKALSKNEIGLNKKFINEHIEQMMCLACMADYLETSEDELKEMIERFKREGCILFS